VGETVTYYDARVVPLHCLPARPYVRSCKSSVKAPFSRHDVEMKSLTFVRVIVLNYLN